MTTSKEEQKKAIYDRMSPRRKRFIERIGYDNWDPFAEPKDPIEWRTDVTNRTTQQLVDRFIKERRPARYTTAYGKAAADMCHGLMHRDERSRAMFDFCMWYRDLLEEEGRLEEFKKNLEAI